MSAAPLVEVFTGEVDDVINKFRDQGLTIAEALGALDLIHAQIIKSAFDDLEDEGEKP